MTKEQLEHYLEGGLFTATYKPTKTSDLNECNLRVIGQVVVVHQNMWVSPILGGRYEGQHRFSSDDIMGWFPEEDLEDLEKLGDMYIDEECVAKLPVYLYRLTYTDRDKIFKNLGKGYEDVELPYLVYRNYSKDMDEFVGKHLSKPRADLIEKALWNGELGLDEIKWKVLKDGV